MSDMAEVPNLLYTQACPAMFANLSFAFALPFLWYTSLYRRASSKLIPALLPAIATIGSRSLASFLDGSLVPSHLGEMGLDILCTDRFPTLGKLFEERR